MIGLLLLACTFEPGRGFGSIEAANFAALHDPGVARDLGEDGFLTNTGYAVRLDSFGASLGELRILELEGGGSSTFDPANPPPGYTLCHGGHCHSTEGALVDYADIEAELAGDNAQFVPRVSFTLEAEVDLLAGFAGALTPPEDDLGESNLTKLELDLEALRFTGVATREGEDPIALSAEIAPAAPLSVGLELPIERGEDPAIALEVALVLDGTLLDELELGAMSAEGSLDLSEDPTVGARVAGVEPALTLTRTPWSDR